VSQRIFIIATSVELCERALRIDKPASLRVFAYCKEPSLRLDLLLGWNSWNLSLGQSKLRGRGIDDRSAVFSADCLRRDVEIIAAVPDIKR
jgi:hypothetical protein